MPRRLRIGIFIDHDILIRHFVLSGVFSSLYQEFDLQYFFPSNRPDRVSIDLAELNLDDLTCVDIEEERVANIRYFCRLNELRNLKKREGADRAAMIRFYREYFGTARRYWKARILALPWVFPIYRLYKRYQFKIEPALEEIVLSKDLDLILHPTVLNGLFVYDLIEIGKRHRIPTIFMMNSWDNPSSKALFQGSPDRLMVWSEQTRAHAIEYCRIPFERIVISGAAQFESYRQNPEMGSRELRELIGVQESTTLILYAGSSKSLNEMRHLEVIDNFLEQQGKRCVVVYKPHPWKDFHKEERAFADYGFKNITLDPLSSPLYDSLIAGERFPISKAKYEDTNTILKAVDAVISPVSTILLEAAMLGKAIAVYSSNDGDEEKHHFNVASGRIQYAEFVDRVRPIVCWEMSELPATINSLFEVSSNPMELEALRERTNYFIKFDSETYPDILTRTIRSVLS